MATLRLTVKRATKKFGLATRKKTFFNVHRNSCLAVRKNHLTTASHSITKVLTPWSFVERGVHTSVYRRQKKDLKEDLEEEDEELEDSFLEVKKEDWLPDQREFKYLLQDDGEKLFFYLNDKKDLVNKYWNWYLRGTYLHFAVGGNKPKCVESLISHGADQKLKIEDSANEEWKDFNALDLAKAKGYTEIAQLLQKYATNPPEKPSFVNTDKPKRKRGRRKKKEKTDEEVSNEETKKKRKKTDKNEDEDEDEDEE
eukprot:TRINITY_DN1148_c0_g2_i5.p1 TRINITY_DN1148_c0_g2~~TRINITY_DN1148_c0_g2_i5.p1  ORF type:complete len:269 (-),score=70.30 TRINITY_DN1148_c0_g2_i5:127-891(-)